MAQKFQPFNAEKSRQAKDKALKKLDAELAVDLGLEKKPEEKPEKTAGVKVRTDVGTPEGAKEKKTERPNRDERRKAEKNQLVFDKLKMEHPEAQGFFEKSASLYNRRGDEIYFDSFSDSDRKVVLFVKLAGEEKAKKKIIRAERLEKFIKNYNKTEKPNEAAEPEKLPVPPKRKIEKVKADEIINMKEGKDFWEKESEKNSETKEVKDEKLAELERAVEEARGAYAAKDYEVTSILAKLKRVLGGHLRSNFQTLEETRPFSNQYKIALSDLLDYQIEKLKEKKLPVYKLDVRINELTKYYNQDEKINLYDAHTLAKAAAWEKNIFGKAGNRIKSGSEKYFNWYRKIGWKKKVGFGVAASLSGAGIFMRIAGGAAAGAGLTKGLNERYRRKEDKRLAKERVDMKENLDILDNPEEKFQTLMQMMQLEMNDYQNSLKTEKAKARNRKLMGATLAAFLGGGMASDLMHWGLDKSGGSELARSIMEKIGANEYIAKAKEAYGGIREKLFGHKAPAAPKEIHKAFEGYSGDGSVDLDELKPGEIKNILEYKNEASKYELNLSDEQALERLNEYPGRPDKAFDKLEHWGGQNKAVKDALSGRVHSPDDAAAAKSAVPPPELGSVNPEIPPAETPRSGVSIPDKAELNHPPIPPDATGAEAEAKVPPEADKISEISGKSVTETGTPVQEAIKSVDLTVSKQSSFQGSIIKYLTEHRVEKGEAGEIAHRMWDEFADKFSDPATKDYSVIQPGAKIEIGMDAQGNYKVIGFQDSKPGSDWIGDPKAAIASEAIEDGGASGEIPKASASINDDRIVRPGVDQETLEKMQDNMKVGTKDDGIIRPDTNTETLKKVGGEMRTGTKGGGETLVGVETGVENAPLDELVQKGEVNIPAETALPVKEVRPSFRADDSIKEAGAGIGAAAVGATAFGAKKILQKRNMAGSPEAREKKEKSKREAKREKKFEKLVKKYKLEETEDPYTRAKKIVKSISLESQENWRAMKDVKLSNLKKTLSPKLNKNINDLEKEMVALLGKSAKPRKGETLTKWLGQVVKKSFKREEREEKLAA